MFAIRRVLLGNLLPGVGCITAIVLIPHIADKVVFPCLDILVHFVDGIVNKGIRTLQHPRNAHAQQRGGSRLGFEGAARVNRRRRRRIKPSPLAEEDLSTICVVCMAAPKTWCFKHGDTAHLCACELCAKKCFMRKQYCPVCNLPAGEILQVFSS